MVDDYNINKKRICPIYVMVQEGVSSVELESILEGLEEMVELADVEGIDILNLGNWRSGDYLNEDGSLKEYQSMEWYIQNGKRRSRNQRQLYVNDMIANLICEPWRDIAKAGKVHYDVLVVKDDLYAEGTNFVVGGAVEGIGTIISTNRFRNGDYSQSELKELIKTETMHEIGHVFGLLPDERKVDVDFSLGKHCTKCTMRQGLTVPDNWEVITVDRLEKGALCKRCESDLKSYFRQ